MTRGQQLMTGPKLEATLFEAVVQYVSEGIVLASLDTADDAPASPRITYANLAFTRLTGYAPEEVRAAGFDVLLCPQSDPRLVSRLHGTIQESRPFVTETVIRRKDGGEVLIEWVVTGVLGESGAPTHLVCMLRDATEQRRVERAVQRSQHDPLTGLPNRTLFVKRLARAIDRVDKSPGFEFAILFIDLDRFKSVNDTLGHLAGDQLLVAAAHAIESCLRPGDTLSRLGGDEFALRLEGIRGAGDASAVAERILERLATPFDLGGHEVATGVSIGIALSETGYRQPDDVLRDADTALYRAKAMGRGRFEMFDTALHSRAVAMLRLEQELRRAIEQDEFWVYYQPIVRLETGRIIAFEALVRWVHPERGIIKPAEFVGAAEEMGFITQIDRKVLWEVCRQVGIWQRELTDSATRLHAHVNLSTRTLTSPLFVEELKEIMETSGLNPGSLRIELPEGVLADAGGELLEVPHRLADIGVQLCIDNFGTGSSSLVALQRPPIRFIKVDRFLVTKIGLQPGRAEFVGTVIALGMNLGLEVIAEGVESEFQRTQLLALRCRYGQGDLFSRPLPPEAAAALLRSGREQAQRLPVTKKEDDS
ncbi:MAG: EAL domain-containing protein [Gemmatimonadetes bacterium]|nr:EAL domain-containing protein [Gemmatimonadota bacterium]